MSWVNKRWPKLLILFIGIVMYFTKYTSADLIDIELIQDNILRATTLDFSNKSTANEMPVSTLFNISGLLSNGFDVETLRIKREGEMDFDYKISTQDITGDPDLCNSLVLTILKDWEIVHAGHISDISYTDTISAVFYQDLVFKLETDGSKNGLGNKNCQFNLSIKTNMDKNSTSFFDEEILQNQVISGTF